MRTFLLVILAALTATPALARDYSALFEDAVRGVTWQYPDHWAYTETRTGKDSSQVARFDPSRPDGERWTLLSVDGREPTEAEIDEFLEDKGDDEGFMSGDGGEDAKDDSEEDDVRTMVEPGSLELLEESDTHWLLRFVPRPDDEEEEKFLEKMNGTVRIAKAGEQLEYIAISADKPVKPAVGVKIREFMTRFEFRRAVDDGPVVPVAFRFRVKGRAYLAIGFDEMQTIEFSDFEPLSFER